jgi:hypothetical protein
VPHKVTATADLPRFGCDHMKKNVRSTLQEDGKMNILARNFNGFPESIKGKTRLRFYSKVRHNPFPQPVFLPVHHKRPVYHSKRTK